MAKTQNLSLNPTKISGTCGRLMCCLKYEQDAYEDLIRNSPKLDSFVDTPEGRGTVVELDLLRQRVKVRMEDAPETIGVFSNTDIAVLRSGKRVRREKVEDEPVRLDPIRFRYSTEAVVDEPEEELITEEASAEEARDGKSRSRRRRKHKAETPKQDAAPKAEEPKAEPAEKPKKDAHKKEQAPKEAKKEQQPGETAEGGEEAAKKPRRRNNFRRHRKPKPTSEG